MADSISFKMLTGPFTKFVDDRERRMQRAAMWTVREGGRVVRRAARAKAPVLKDSSRASYAQIRKGVKFRKAGGVGPIQGEGISGPGGFNAPVPGLLKASIGPGRMKSVAGVYTLKVGPRGGRVHLYAGKEERREGYMRAGHAAAEAMMKAVAEHAYGRVWKGI